MYRGKRLLAAAARRKKTPLEQRNRESRDFTARHPGNSTKYAHRRRERVGEEAWKQIQAESRERHVVSRRIHSLNTRALRAGAPGQLTNQDLYILHKWQDHCCFWCRCDLAGKHHIDHIIALNRGGTNDRSNIVLACATCNTSKQDRVYPDEWMPKTIREAPRTYSIYATAEFAKTLRSIGIRVQDGGDHIIADGQKIIVASSFWASDFDAMREARPEAIVLIDRNVMSYIPAPILK